MSHQPGSGSGCSVSPRAPCSAAADQLPPLPPAPPGPGDQPGPSVSPARPVRATSQTKLYPEMVRKQIQAGSNNFYIQFYSKNAFIFIFHDFLTLSSRKLYRVSNFSKKCAKNIMKIRPKSWWYLSFRNFQFGAKKIDVFSRFGFPFVFFIFNIWYWSYYLTREHKQTKS